MKRKDKKACEYSKLDDKTSDLDKFTQTNRIKERVYDEKC